MIYSEDIAGERQNNVFFSSENFLSPTLEWLVVRSESCNKINIIFSISCFKSKVLFEGESLLSLTQFKIFTLQSSIADLYITQDYIRFHLLRITIEKIKLLIKHFLKKSMKMPNSRNMIMEVFTTIILTISPSDSGVF